MGADTYVYKRKDGIIFLKRINFMKKKKELLQNKKKERRATNVNGPSWLENQGTTYAYLIKRNNLCISNQTIAYIHNTL
jgi:hypothetical protein